MVSEAEFGEIVKQNRAISNSATSKVISGARAGDYSDLIEMMLAAITVIKQSQVVSDECCCVLISPLKSFMALKPSPTVWVPAGALPEKDICSEIV